MIRRVAVAIVATTVLAACSSSGHASSPPTATTTVRGSVADVPAGTGTDWPIYGRDLANSRTNPGAFGLTSGTVSHLAPTWTEGGLVGVTGTPVVVGGIAYFDDWTGKVHAVDAATGAVKWVTAIGGAIVASPAVDRDAVFAASGVDLFRLDRTTGRVQWKVSTNEHPFGQISASPVVVDGLVLQGVASFEVTLPRAKYTFRGSIGAYDERTGRQAWRFYTTNNDAHGGAGVGIWSTPAVDRARHLLYVGSGNAYAPPTGPNADSILAIDYRTGKLRWSAQFTNPDVWSAGNPKGKDADVGASPNLWTSNGRDLVGAGDKAGVFHAVDRDTGKVLWQTRLTPGSVFGGEIGSAAFVDHELVVVSNVGDAATNSPTNVCRVFALDPATGKVLWKTGLFPQMIFGPVSAVPGVAFVGTTARTLLALDTGTGRTLWSRTAPAKVGGGASIVDGRVLWGYGFTLFGGPGPGGITSYAVPQ